jgi:membrane protease YdiL (CAAX protease family)
MPPKVKHFTSTIIILWFFFALSWLVALRERIVLFPEEVPAPRLFALGAAVLVGMVVLMRPLWKSRVAARSRKLWLFMPRTGQERALWIACSCAAGISEEVTYRGVLFTLLWRVTDSALAAACLMAAVFSISHFLQGRKSMALIFAIAMIFQGLAWLSGSLYIGMLVHALYDVAAGLFYGKYGDELGYPVEPLPPTLAS